MTAEIAADRVRLKLALLREKQETHPRWVSELVDLCRKIIVHASANAAHGECR